MTGWILYSALGVADAVLLGGLILATLYLRRKHPGHVFTIWYAFWLMLILFSGLFYYVWASERSISGSILSGNSPIGGFIVWFQKTSMDFHDERYLIASIYIIVVLPQVFSYLVSGIFGCANRLVLVEWITAAVTWLLIKFLAVLSGILMAQAIAALYAKPVLRPADLPPKLLYSIMMISLSFIVAGVFYFTYEYRFRRMLVKIRKPFKPLISHMRRYAASAEAREAKKKRYAWLRTRARKLASGVLWN
ncbi:glucan phosphoethanolaminetransferase (alkaline phosphatase superfamily) [Bradyrhizobium japonicum]|uniref:Glucan phosphoethanolaminetransferase (Alkaline phosphatase superfamily) n=1 Tax=Bradyrhizobium japonicum TaxID=375 RepID=A0ABV2RTA6_BRAJP|nr:hypothetical protein [Bradyrhizobium japonicum]UQD97181.1 hypothetical protein JEY30_37695 [Bradyrhizobium japonicum]WLB17289.1 hypothetical protein QIH95_35575 [Bradyrhizobium japonicum]